MIYGAPRWNDPDRYYSQENNPTEEPPGYLRAVYPIRSRRIWLWFSFDSLDFLLNGLNDCLITEL